MPAVLRALAANGFFVISVSLRTSSELAAGASEWCDMPLESNLRILRDPRRGEWERGGAIGWR